MKRFFAALALGSCCIGGNASAQVSPNAGASLDTLFNQYLNDGPGAVLIVSRNGQQLFHKEFGYASLEHKVPITNETVFEAASVSKQFTAAAVLLLVQQGRISLDDDIRKFVPELPDYGNKIDVRMCLTHTSGLKDWRNVTYLSALPTGQRLFNQDDAIDMICRQSNLNYKPGTRYSYTNAGFDLLGIVVERVTKKSFAAFVKDSLLTPAGMKHSAFRNRFEDIIPNMASAYYGPVTHLRHGYTTDETYGAAGLITCADDLRRWNEFINKGKLAQTRLQRYVLISGDTISYAVGGVHVMDFDGIREISHSGLLSGYRALVLYYPQYDISVTYMTNNKNIITADLQVKIFEILFGKKRKAAIPAVQTNYPDVATLQNKTGAYYGVEDESEFFSFHISNNKLICHEALLQPVGTNEFIYETTGYRFSSGGDTLIVKRGGEETWFRKATSFKPDAAALKPFTGAFYSKDAIVELTFELRGNKLVAFRNGYDSVVLTPAYQRGNQTAFRGFDHGLRAIYLFTQSKKGAVNDCTINLPRANYIPFSRSKSK
ncbi:serine hydrolase domain-containing protein [Pseudobacter ginsenosidimutans]|uniref:CubicO group peptidase (Beta-lactamase class C family) n=1 Tax=Pseudobacter ginsenosidimutans TaxID=661488 RepID=A0A4Q7N2Z3_9BACT|nr:serine hydrolase domain-containing protein [Pseudobacter ginsenosidimutans]QEC43261.1 beta-lactamase family protein [Pseudobacter ginsenosidimutans]RZS74625.1 CubicO group peptidase (beta-lactamase class C family) [Pseudobacter ginsenosidimutans]